jgi:DnaJ-class molecular chaperone
MTKYFVAKAKEKTMAKKRKMVLVLMVVFAIIAVGSVYAAAYRCPRCRGQGTIICGICRGTGRNDVYKNRYVPCPSCNGQGENICTDCGGDGWKGD